MPVDYNAMYQGLSLEELAQLRERMNAEADAAKDPATRARLRTEALRLSEGLLQASMGRQTLDWNTGAVRQERPMGAQLGQSPLHAAEAPREGPSLEDMARMELRDAAARAAERQEYADRVASETDPLLRRRDELMADRQAPGWRDVRARPPLPTRSMVYADTGEPAVTVTPLYDAQGNPRFRNAR